MITNREISSRALFVEALGELLESAREHDVQAEEVAQVLRARAVAVDGIRGSDESEVSDDAQR